MQFQKQRGIGCDGRHDSGGNLVVVVGSGGGSGGGIGGGSGVDLC